MAPEIPGLKFATPRNPERPTIGTRQAAFARVWLGQPLMPWQALVAEVTGELLPSGLPAYPLVVVTVQRQAGKSHLAMAQTGERCFTRSGFRAWYTAQTGGDARDQFLKFNDDVVEGTPLSHVVRTLRGNGHEVMRFPNKSQIRPYPPTEGALHGKQSDRNDIDEAWAFTTDEGKALLQASGPAALTRPGEQTFIWSAGGTANSTWLAELVARGRAGDPGLCFFELGIPDDMAVDDLEGIAAHHPAYGHTVTLESIKALRDKVTDDAEFARAAGNRWTEVIGGAIPARLWESVRHQAPIPEGVPVSYGAARAADGSEVAIAAAAVVDGVMVAELLDVMPAYGAAEHVKGWASGGIIATAAAGASAPLADGLGKAHARVRSLAVREVSAAVGNLMDALPHGGYRFRPHPALDGAVKVAGLRTVDGGGRVWSQTAAGSIAALEAVTYATAAAATPLDTSPPTFRFAGAA